MHAAYAIVATALSVLAFSSKPAVSQAYPSRPITIIVPFAAGGPLDTLARMMSDRLGVELGQGVVIENHAGGGGSTGIGHVAHAAAPAGFGPTPWPPDALALLGVSRPNSPLGLSRRVRFRRNNCR